MAWTVVIPSDSKEHLEVAVASLVRTHPSLDPKNIHVITHSINKEDLSPLGKELTVVQDDIETFNFSRRVNIGFRVTAPHDVVLMGDDVEIMTPKAFELLSHEAPLRLLAASVRGRIGPWWQRESETHLDAPFVSFTCLYIPRLVYETVGELDETLPGYGYEDTDYCVRAKRLGFSVGVCGMAVVEHSVRIPSSFIDIYKGELPAMEMAAREAFFLKLRNGGLRTCVLPSLDGLPTQA